MTLLLLTGCAEAYNAVHANTTSTEADATHVRVTSVVDGDTLRVEALDGTELGRVRLLGIDTPETGHGPTYRSVSPTPPPMLSAT